MTVEKTVERGALWKRFGPPTEQLGSANDPRTTEECGVRWNEKWLYRDPKGDGSDRMVFWNRYDLLGVFTRKPDGSVERESLDG